jgi:hypothetical protein
MLVMYHVCDTAQLYIFWTAAQADRPQAAARILRSASSKSAYHGDRHEWRGPYCREFSVTLMIARELRKEIRKRHKL